jgi:pyruvate,orthophosphate dikinase
MAKAKVSEGAANTTKMVFFFSSEFCEGSVAMKPFLGGKGANLADMCRCGLPVPPGFTITTDVCDQYNKNNKKFPSGLDAQVREHLRRLEHVTGKKLGSPRNPLLVSVRSGAAVSMPGMMDTILNLGINDHVVEGIAALTNNPRFAWDSYRRFIQMFGDVAMGVPHHAFEHELEEVKRRIAKKKGVVGAEKLVQEALNKEVPDTALDVNDLQELVTRYKAVYKKVIKSDFPQDPEVQMWAAIKAVFGSWNNDRAIAYRELNNIKGLLGTAVNIQSMVFGNMGDDSGTGVAFTRDPSTGENRFYGEFLMNAQGEDVVAGIRTPLPISELSAKDPGSYRQLLNIRSILERHYTDMQDIEFTIEKGKLYMLQTRSGKRTAAAAVKVATDMVREKLIDKQTALLRITPEMIDQLLHPQFDVAEEKKAKILSKAGHPASPGAAVGQIVFTAKEAEEWAKDSKKVILCRVETSPEDIRGMHASQGILTVRGGMTSHAAVVARGMGKCCVSGAGDIVIDYRAGTMTVNGVTLKKGAWISLNGSKGLVYDGAIKTAAAKLAGPFAEVMRWADEFRELGVRMNADTPRDTQVGVEFGAEGIGLCRTEHMFFEGERIVAFRKLIVVAPDVKALRDKIATTNDKSEKARFEKELAAPMKQYLDALKELLPLQRKDFEGMFTALKGRPCTIRFLDPPLHEFLPHDDAGQQQLAKALGIDVAKVKSVVALLHEFNPMLGHRGCRLGMTYPEITKMQTQAVLEAAFNVQKKKIKVVPEIMIPLVGIVSELVAQKKVIAEATEEFLAAKKIKKLPFELKIGTMIEVPRAAVTADEIAAEAEFFSFGTNDLTQMGSGFSRDDAGRFLTDYVRDGIYEQDPFQTLDQKGIGKLIRYAVQGGRSVRKDMKMGICGEHGGEPKSIAFCHDVGLTYVSCSPYRVPVARLAAAHASIKAHAHAQAHHKK